MKPMLALCLISSLFLSACSPILSSVDNRSLRPWTSSDPLSIPHPVRLAQWERGNLVQNASFEKGAPSADDPSRKSVPRGWEIVGRHVRWVRQEPGGDGQKVTFSGARSIKISKSTASEMDDAAGILSAMMPVIPGNYDFTYHVRLQDVSNHRSRLGVQLYDAIVVRVLYFDEDKQPVDPGCPNPIGAGLIDSSDKSFSFSNYWRIDAFPWGQVRGRTYNYPYSEGDIPDQARYVRLFFGLKGKGTMWLDDVYYGYSKWNFTALERFSPFFDQPRAPRPLIIPTPKHVAYRGAIPYFGVGRPDMTPPVIVVPEQPAVAERTAARLLQTSIEETLNRLLARKGGGDTKAVQRLTDFPLEGRRNPRLIFSIGDSKVYRTIRPNLTLAPIDGKPQGYLIQGETHADSHVVFLMGNSPIATFYAAVSALQLFATDGFVYHDATVLDYPDFLGRPYVFQNWTTRTELQKDLDAVQRMSRYKLNKVYFGYNRKTKRWYQPDALYRRGLAQAGRSFKESGVMHLAVMVNPYSHFPMEAPVAALDRRQTDLWTHHDPQSLARLKDVFSIGLQAGADTIMLLSDDFLPHKGTNRQHYVLYDQTDRQRFVSLSRAQAYTINRLSEWLDTAYPGTRFEFCPPWYSNEHIDRGDGLAEVYFRELMAQIPREVAIIWTGPTIRSLSIDMADLQRYRSLIGKWPMLWDNTLYARNIETKRYGGYTAHYPGKVRMCNLFEPYDALRPENFQRFNDGRHLYINGSAFSEVYKIKYATVADYAWNSAAYHPERSLWSVLCRSYGPACAQELIYFSDSYYHLYGVCMRMAREEKGNAVVEKGQQVLLRLNAHLRKISRLLTETHPLTKELQRFRDRQQNRFERLSRAG